LADRLSAFLTLAAMFIPGYANGLTLDLQRCGLGTGAITVQKEQDDLRRAGVIAVDVSNFHWCKTATMRVDAFVPRMNKAMEAARELGMTVIFCPSDVVENHAGEPQREAMVALPRALAVSAASGAGVPDFPYFGVIADLDLVVASVWRSTPPKAMPDVRTGGENRAVPRDLPPLYVARGLAPAAVIVLQGRIHGRNFVGSAARVHTTEHRHVSHASLGF